MGSQNLRLHDARGTALQIDLPLKKLREAQNNLYIGSRVLELGKVKTKKVNQTVHFDLPMPSL